MKQTFCILLFTCILGIANAQIQKLNAADSTAIVQIMAAQEAAWNTGDLSGFMNGYWESDDLKFVGKSGITYGYKATLDRYKRGYPDAATMGNLHFTLLSFEALGKNHALVVGKWYLKREIGDASGHFSLIWRKIKGKWVIVADHSS